MTELMTSASINLRHVGVRGTFMFLCSATIPYSTSPMLALTNSHSKQLLQNVASVTRKCRFSVGVTAVITHSNLRQMQ